MQRTGETIWTDLCRRFILQFPNYPLLYVRAVCMQFPERSCPEGCRGQGLYPSSLQPVGQFRALRYPALLLHFFGISSFPKAPFAVISDGRIPAAQVSQLQMRLDLSTSFSAQHVGGKGIKQPGKNLRDLFIVTKALKCTGKQKKTHWKMKQVNVLPVPVLSKELRGGFLMAPGAEAPICWLHCHEDEDVECQNGIKKVYLLYKSLVPCGHSLSWPGKGH